MLNKLNRHPYEMSNKTTKIHQCMYVYLCPVKLQYELFLTCVKLF